MCVLCELEKSSVAFEVIGEYIVAGIHEDEWDIVKTALVELEGEDSEFLHRVLARCSSAPTMRDFDADAHMLLDDETYEREQRRERSGFVTPQMAAVFLKTARQAARDDLVAQTDYDAITQRYFDQLRGGRGAAAVEQPTARRRRGEPTKSRMKRRSLRCSCAPWKRRWRTRRSPAIGRPQLLAGPKDAREPTLELQARLDRLQLTRPDLFAARLGELIFLANVLMSGSWYQGARFTESRGRHSGARLREPGAASPARGRVERPPNERVGAR